MSYFAMMNPLANASVFVGLTEGQDDSTKKKLVIKAILSAFSIIVVFTIAGPYLFKLFGISIEAFRITGGFLIACIGLQMLHGESSKVQHPQTEDHEDAKNAALNIAISPLSIPILAGPGTIATTLSFSGHGNIQHSVITIAAFSTILAINGVAFLIGGRIIHLIGESGIKVVTRLMGLILAVVGVQMLADGILAMLKP